jgi:hypothetical protein
VLLWHEPDSTPFPALALVHLPHLGRDEVTVAIAKWNMLWEAAQSGDGSLPATSSLLS